MNINNREMFIYNYVISLQNLTIVFLEFIAIRRSSQTKLIAITSNRNTVSNNIVSVSIFQNRLSPTSPKNEVFWDEFSGLVWSMQIQGNTVVSQDRHPASVLTESTRCINARERAGQVHAPTIVVIRRQMRQSVAARTMGIYRDRSD